MTIEIDVLKTALTVLLFWNVALTVLLFMLNDFRKTDIDILRTMIKFYRALGRDH